MLYLNNIRIIKKKGVNKDYYWEKAIEITRKIINEFDDNIVIDDVVSPIGIEEFSSRRYRYITVRLIVKGDREFENNENRNKNEIVRRHFYNIHAPELTTSINFFITNAE